MLRHNLAESHRQALLKRRALAHPFRALLQHLNALHPSALTPPPIRPKTFRAGRRSGFHSYPFPTDSDLAQITLEDLVYGKGLPAPLFLLAVTEDGQPIKLRWYPKPDYVGPTLSSTPYAYPGSQWLVSYVIDRSGAADLLVAVPMDVLPFAIASPDISRSSPSATRALNDMIRDAQSRMEMDARHNKGSSRKITS